MRLLEVFLESESCAKCLKQICGINSDVANIKHLITFFGRGSAQTWLENVFLVIRLKLRLEQWCLQSAPPPDMKSALQECEYHTYVCTFARLRGAEMFNSSILFRRQSEKINSALVSCLLHENYISEYV